MALVVTIVILIIISTVTINAALGEKGLIKAGQDSKDTATNEIIAEEEKTNKLEQELANAVREDKKIILPALEETDNSYVDNSLVVAPKLSDGMVPVKWNGTNWVKTTAEDSEWYNYAEQKWANVVLTPTSGEKAGKDATGETNVFNVDGTLNGESAYSMLVWIPRYAYQITSQYHQSGTGNINIVFIDTENKNNDKTKTYSEKYPTYTTGTGMSGVAEEKCETGYVVHPAFNYGGTKIPGFWVGKYETSNTNCTTTASTGEYNNTNKIVTIKSGVTSWRNITVSNMFTVCTNLNNVGNPYGISASDTVVDPHMMKNTEWGAVVYLSQNKEYGKGTEITVNDNSSYITADGDYINNKSQSTTGNIWGIYDMSGGAWEYVTAYVNNGHENLTTYGKSLVTNANAKYKDVYQASGTTGGNDNQEQNYNLSTPEKGKYGDAVYETSNSYSGSNSWNSENSAFPDSNSLFFIRGGYYDASSNAGVFCFNKFSGNASSYSSFRVVLPVM